MTKDQVGFEPIDDAGSWEDLPDQRDLISRARQVHAEIVAEDGGESGLMRMLRELCDRVETLEAAGRVVIGWREYDRPAHFDRWTADYMADRYRAALVERGER